MNYIMSEGNTFEWISFPNEAVVRISILSRRGAALAIRQSLRGKWKRRVIAYAQMIAIEGVYVVGFQPETGTHIAIKGKRYEELI